MRKMALLVATLALGGCAMETHPLVPDTPQGPASYICYSSLTTNADEVRTVAQRQCARWGLSINGVLGQSWTPMRCGFLTPTVAAFSCGRY